MAIAVSLDIEIVVIHLPNHLHPPAMAGVATVIGQIRCLGLKEALNKCNIMFSLSARTATLAILILLYSLQLTACKIDVKSPIKYLGQTFEAKF